MRRLALAAALLLPAAASAYVRSTTDTGVPVWWSGSCAYLFIDTSTPTADLSFETVQQVVTKSIANWQTVTLDAGCSYLAMHLDAPAAGEAHLDQQNVIKFRTDKWCRPAEKNTAEMCYSTQAAAITTVFYSADGKHDGAILDADIELNAMNYTFTVLPSTQKARQGTQLADLENTLTHELGHFQGLDHTCDDGATSRHPVDDTGAPIPTCEDVRDRKVSAAVYERVITATMYNYAAAGETQKRTPEADDIAGICGTYPKAKDPSSCDPVGQGGTCSSSGSRRDAPGALALLSLMVAGLWLRRHRRR